nr:immunoglobulin heavy chain junction region [Mus musculus]MBK4197761.1 immunoglobulin heavy chain junction region [Mus musculus]
CARVYYSNLLYFDYW